jgi:hypothetical protein
VERTQIFFEFDLNEHSVLAALLFDGKDFCGDGSHLGHFLRLTSAGDGTRLQSFGYWEASVEERVGDTRAFHRKCPTRFCNAIHSDSDYGWGGLRQFTLREVNGGTYCERRASVAADMESIQSRLCVH